MINDLQNVLCCFIKMGIFLEIFLTVLIYFNCLVQNARKDGNILRLQNKTKQNKTDCFFEFQNFKI